MFIQEQTWRTKYVEIAAKRGQGTTDWKFKKTKKSLKINKGNNKITELRTIFQRESKNS
jgi:hypothetical protein